ncbi:hypothetical protein HDU93_005014 [Gonapodya sp. JEL0774]|nr:hypothetical protein HDU93_005014 [Gonapodya sp. JEL0774]
MSWDAYGAQPGQVDTRTSVWMGELEPWMDENFLRNTWYSMGENVQVKMIRDKFTGGYANYCFIEFPTNAAAAAALAKFQNQMIPNANKIFRLNWASGGGSGGAAIDRGGPGAVPRMMDQGPEYSIFVGDLAPEVTDYTLMSLFSSHYESVKSAKVVTDPLTNASRGYGFVRFRDENEQMRALNEMQGVFCGSRAMRISMATPKNKDLTRGFGGGTSSGSAFSGAPTGGYVPPPTPAPPISSYGQQSNLYNPFTDPNNTTVFVGGLSATVTEEELRQHFGPYGIITYTKIPPGKGCGFVQYADRQAAEQAIGAMNGYLLGGSRVRLSWGRAHNAPPTPGNPLPGSAPSPMSLAPSYPAAAGPMYPYYGQPVPGVPMVPMFPFVAMPIPPEDPTKPLDQARANEELVDERERISGRSEASGWRVFA